MVIFHGYVSHNQMGARNQQGKSMLSIRIQAMGRPDPERSESRTLQLCQLGA
jgi:hypothetical protein